MRFKEQTQEYNFLDLKIRELRRQIPAYRMKPLDVSYVSNRGLSHNIKPKGKLAGGLPVRRSGSNNGRRVQSKRTNSTFSKVESHTKGKTTFTNRHESQPLQPISKSDLEPRLQSMPAQPKLLAREKNLSTHELESEVD